MKPLINVLTRTSNRPNSFSGNVKFIRNQTYKNIRHIVCTDDVNSIPYIKENGIEDFLLVNKDELIKKDNSVVKNVGRFPFNLYFNEMMKLVTDGWIMFLDDDDRFLDENSAQSIADMIAANDENTIIYWRMVYADGKFLPKDMSNRRRPIFCEIGAPCFTFHHKWIDHASWDGWKGSDFRTINRLHNIIPKKAWLPENLIYIPSIGWGFRKDINKPI